MGKQHRITAAYHAQSNGLVEKNYRTIEDMSKKQVSPPRCELAENIQLCLIYY